MSRDEQLLRQFTAVTLAEVPIAVETVVAMHTTGEGEITGHCGVCVVCVHVCVCVCVIWFLHVLATRPSRS